MGQSGVEKHLHVLWKSTALAALLAGCSWRSAEAPLTPEVTAAPAPVFTVPVPAEVLSVADADGKTRLTLPPHPEFNPGDVLHIKAAERLIATALVTEVTADHTAALVVALTDRRRPVQVHDAFVVPPPDAEPPPPDPVVAAREQAAARLALVAAMNAPLPTPPATVESAPAPEPQATSVAAAESVHSDAVSHGAAATGAAATPTVDTDQEIRARLEAERAYWDLAARVLRLPPAGPDLATLQERLRQEFAVREPQEVKP
jgi:hypothetical protein